MSVEEMTTKILLKLERIDERLETHRADFKELKEAVCGSEGLQNTVLLLKERETRRDHFSKAALTASMGAIAATIASYLRRDG